MKALEIRDGVRVVGKVAPSARSSRVDGEGRGEIPGNKMN